MIDKVESIIIGKVIIETLKHFYRGADKFLTRTTSRCIMFNGENISFDASLVIYIYIYIYKQYQYSSNYDYKKDI